MQNPPDRDTLFAQARYPGDFVFDDKVASVFEDMVNRSVPGYTTIISMIGLLAERFYQPGSRIYDLGCSLGAASFSCARNLRNCNPEIIAIDNSRAMIEQLHARLGENGEPDKSHFTCLCEDICESEISNASVVILNLTLQFIAPGQRESLVRKIYNGMLPGGILILSEKIVFPDQQLNQLFIELYHGFKESQGYSKLEISQKRAALESVLLPETVDAHRERLAGAGFESVDLWFQCFNFASLVAIKSAGCKGADAA